MISKSTRKPGLFLERQQVVPSDIEEVFAFFSDPRNLEAITPPWLNFRIESSSTPVIQEGTRLEYRLRVHGIPLRWTSLITFWNPPFGFVDEQVRGPYRSWVHRHSFETIDGGVLMTDRIDYGVTGGTLINNLFVRPDLDRIFDYRRDRLEDLFPGSPGKDSRETGIQRPGLREA